MGFCPHWIFDVACAEVAREYLNRNIDLAILSSGYTNVLAGYFEGLSAEEVKETAEALLRFLDEINAGDGAENALRGFVHHRIKFDGSNQERKMKKLFGACDEPAKQKEHSGKKTTTAFKAYIFALRNNVSELAPPGWQLSDVHESTVISALDKVDINPLDFI